MKLRTFLIITAIIYVPFGLAMVIAPYQLFGLYGFDLNPAGAVLGQVVGAAITGLGVINFRARNGSPGSEVIKAILIGNLIYHALDLVQVGMATYTGVVGALTWSFVGLHLVLVFGFSYFLLRKK